MVLRSKAASPQNVWHVRLAPYYQRSSRLADTETVTMEAKEIAKLLKLLSVETRVRIVNLKDRPLRVNALAARLAVTQGALSQHLCLMRNAGLAIDYRYGYFVHYRLNEGTLAVNGHSQQIRHRGLRAGQAA